MLRKLKVLAMTGLLLTGLTTQASANEGADVGIMADSVRNCDGRYEQFRVNGKTVEHRWEFTPGGAMSDWSPLGGDVKGNTTVAAIVNAGPASTRCRVEIFVTWSNLDVRNRWQTSPGGNWNSGWHNLDGTSNFNPQAYLLADGRARVCATGPSWTECRTQSTPGAGPWTAWTRV